MASARWRLGFAAVVLLAALIGRAAEGPKSGDAKMPREPEKVAPVADESKPAPGTITLTLKEYQDLLDRVARLDGSARAEPPSSCKITGRLAGDVARLHVEFGFRTVQPRARVALGCPQGYPTDAKIDGHFPVLKWGADGWSAQVEDAGDHQLVLEMDLPLVSRDKGAERGFDLDLPAAATTALELAELPTGVKRVQVRPTLREAQPKPPAAREFKVESAGNGPGRFATPGLGPVERLEVSWEGHAPAAGPALLGVSGSRIVTHVDEHNLTTRAELTVAVRRGLMKELQLLVPPQAVIRGPEGDDRVQPIDQKGSLRTIHLKPTADPLTLTIDVAQPRSGGSILIGPFVVLGAFPQGGDLIITAPAGMTLDYHPRGGSQYLLTQREPTENEKREFPNVLALRYSTLPGVERAAPLPFLELETELPKGTLPAGVTHVLRLVPGEGERPGAWRVTTTLDARPSHTEVAELSVRLPENYTFDESAGPQPTEAEVGQIDSAGHTVKFVLRPPRRAPFKVTFEGLYDPLEVPATERGQMTVALPGLLGRKIDLRSQVSVVLPPDLELVAPRAGPLWEAGRADGPGKRTWTFERWPERFEVAWRPYRPELVVNGDARVTLLGRQATVTQRLWLQSGQQALPMSIPLSVPPEAMGLTVAGAGERKEAGAPGASLPPQADRDHPLVLNYSFRLPERVADAFKVPLVTARQATGGETRVCVWSDPGTRPELKEGPWEVMRTEEVKDEGSYPSLVLLSRQPAAALTLALGDAGGAPLPAFRVERALIQATVAESGQQRYRARFLVSQIASPWIDVDLPAALFRPNPPDVTVLFAGKAAAWRPVDEAGKETGVSKTARVQVPADLAGKSAVLEIGYVLLPGRAVLQTELKAPQLRGDPGVAPLRWQVVLPASWVPLSQDTLGSEYGWGRRGWLMALRPTVSTGDFERWFADSDPVRADEIKPYPDPTVAVWRSSPEPLRLSHVPERPWLLVCSLTLLIVGLALAFLSLPRAVFWGTLAATGVGALLAGLLWPGLLGAILYGCEPGALVLLPVLGFQWVLHQRYRRQVVFLPGFTRIKAGSSLVRGSSNRPRGEPSTVDASPPVPSGQRPAGESKPQADGTAG
jgi:hypothetical protein